MKMAKFGKHGYWITSDGKQSHFTVSETMCKCGCEESHVAQILLDRMEALRVKLGKPILISSGFRCPTWNERVGGAPLSGHISGEAFDYYCPRLQLSQLWLFTERLDEGFDGLGSYPESKPPFLHLDCLGDRYSRWLYRGGKYYYLF